MNPPGDVEEKGSQSSILVYLTLGPRPPHHVYIHELVASSGRFIVPVIVDGRAVRGMSSRGGEGRFSVTASLSL